MAMDHINSGVGPPMTTPSEVGHHYIDTVARQEYVSVGTDSSADWIPRSGSGGGTGNFINVGNPEGVITASPGARCRDPVAKVDYVKDSGSGNTGWV